MWLPSSRLITWSERPVSRAGLATTLSGLCGRAPTYNKLFTKILDSSIWLEPDATRLVWLTLIAAMDEDGFCQFASVANLAHRARVALEAATTAVETLSQPDPNSGDPEHDGRRIERVAGGWMVLNAAKYRDIVTRVIQREQTRARVQRHRQARNASVTVSNDSVTPSEAYAEARSEADTRTRARVRAPLIDQREHRNHAHCGRVCLHAGLFGEFVRRRNHDQADGEIRDWAMTVEREWGPGGPKAAVETGNLFDFWRARYEERWPTPATAKADTRPAWIRKAKG